MAVPRSETDSSRPYIAATGVYLGALISFGLLTFMVWGELGDDPFRQGIMALLVFPAWVLIGVAASKKPLSHFGFKLSWSKEATRGLVLLLPVIGYNVWNAAWRWAAMAASPQHNGLSGTLGVAFETGLIAPVAEEMLLRGYVLTILLDGAHTPRRWLGLSSLSWYVSVLFLLPHLNLGTSDFILVNLSRFYGSLVVCWVFEKTRNLSGLIAAHFLANLPTALVALVPLLLG